MCIRDRSNTPRMITGANRKWMIYDSVYTYGDDDEMWVRGITSVHSIEPVSYTHLDVYKRQAYSQQRYKHQYCCAWDCILQILFSSYQISLSLNQSFFAKIRSISISSPCHFYFVLYCFIGFFCPCICPYQSS